MKAEGLSERAADGQKERADRCESEGSRDRDGRKGDYTWFTGKGRHQKLDQETHDKRSLFMHPPSRHVYVSTQTQSGQLPRTRRRYGHLDDTGARWLCGPFAPLMHRHEHF